MTAGSWFKKKRNKKIFTLIIIFLITLTAVFILFSLPSTTTTINHTKVTTYNNNSSSGGVVNDTWTNTTIITTTTPPNVLGGNPTVVAAIITAIFAAIGTYLTYNFTQADKRIWTRTESIWDKLNEKTTKIVMDLKEMQLILRAKAYITQAQIDLLSRRTISGPDPEKIIISYGQWVVASYPDFFRDDDKEFNAIGKFIKNPLGNDTITDRKSKTVIKDFTTQWGNSPEDTKKNEFHQENIKFDIKKEKMESTDQNIGIKLKLEDVIPVLLNALNAAFIRLYNDVNDSRVTLGVISYYSDEMNDKITEILEYFKTCHNEITYKGLSSLELISKSTQESTSNKPQELFKKLNDMSTVVYYDKYEECIRDKIIDIQNLCKNELELTRTGRREELRDRIIRYKWRLGQPQSGQTTFIVTIHKDGELPKKAMMRCSVIKPIKGQSWQIYTSAIRVELDPCRKNEYEIHVDTPGFKNVKKDMCSVEVIGT